MFGGSTHLEDPPALHGHVLPGECFSPRRSQIWLCTPAALCSTCLGGASLRAEAQEAPRGRGAPSLCSQCQTPASGTYLPYAETHPCLAAAAQTQSRPMRSVPARSTAGGGRRDEGETYQVTAQRCLHARSVRHWRYPAVREGCYIIQPANELFQLAAKHLLNKS